MKIQLKELRLQNFKGEKDFKLSDLGNEVSISGCNASGKTRLFDAFTWLNFGKDSEDRNDFNIKSLDVNNQPLHKADHSVSAVLDIAGLKTKLERVLREKWVKKRGEETTDFDGNETLYKVNDVPHKEGEYQQKINNILPENLFKLLTNPFYFNTKLKWNERREILFKVAGDIKDNEVIAMLPELKDLLNSLNGKSLEEFKKEIAFKKKSLKQELADIPARMDEVNRSIQPDPDYVKVEKQIRDLDKKIGDTDTLITSAAKKFEKKNHENQGKHNSIYELKHKILDLEYNSRNNAEKTINKLRFKKEDLQRSAVTLEQNIGSLQNIIRTEQNAIDSLTAENDNLRKAWVRMNEEVLSFAKDEFICPTCIRPFEADDIEARKSEMTANFNNDKAARLKRISDKGKVNKTEIDRLKAEIQRNQKEIETITAEISGKLKEAEKIIIPSNPIITPDPQIKTLQDQIVEIEKTIIPLITEITPGLVIKKQDLTDERDLLRQQLLIRESNEKLRSRLTELEDQQKSLSQQIASIEKQEFQCEKFIITKVKMVEDKINGLFSFVRFKLFDKLINGGLEETCEALIKGVPFRDANNGAKINAGIDIINAFSKHYDVYAPIFVDNAEAINEIFKTKSQMIKLFVTEDKELKVITN